ncbi:MAG TPA: DUF4870 domain-containing protein [Rhizomicrobium sp.]|nr:DUF4870 domain-containing protein [Rhizomicrobium sp.]
MSDASQNQVSPAVSREESLRTTSIIVYLLYLAALVNGVTAIIGVVLAYVKRDDARGTIYEGHFTNAIETFWIFLIGMLIAVPLCFILIGIPLVVAIYVWVLYRTIKGIVRAIDGKPF